MHDLTRRYPFTVKPHHLETLASYTARVLAINFEDDTHQRHLTRLGQLEDHTLSPDDNWERILSAKTDRDLSRLHSRNAPKMIHMDGSSCAECRRSVGVRIACTHCTSGTTVYQHPHFDINICLEHSRWVAPGTAPVNQKRVGSDVVAAERKFRRLRRQGRIDAPFYFALRDILRPAPSSTGTFSDEASLYPLLVALAAALTGREFVRRFFDPSGTFSEAFALLASTVLKVGVDSTSIVRDLWLYFRPSFLSLRESLDAGKPYAPAMVHEYVIPGYAYSTQPAVQRPLEPFQSFLRPTGDEELTNDNVFGVLSPLPLLTPGSSEPYARVPAICVVGHRTERRLIDLTAPAARRRAQCGVCNHSILRAGVNDMATTHPQLAREFARKNLPLTPQTVFAGSAKAYWWTCSEGHEFEATASNRSAAKSQCPVCQNRRIITGINDAATLHPHLVAEFHPEKNPNHKLDRLAPGSNVLLWWRCAAGHSFRATLGKRTRGASCHYCRRRKTHRMTVAASRPDLAAEWHPSNLPLTPEDVTIGSARDIAWVCANSHTYTQRPERRNAGYGCPICSGRRYVRGVNDAETRFPEVCTEWHPSKNCFKEASDILPGNALYWWKCRHHHVTHQSVPHRVKSGGCTECPPETRVARQPA